MCHQIYLFFTQISKRIVFLYEWLISCSFSFWLCNVIACAITFIVVILTGIVVVFVVGVAAAAADIVPVLSKSQAVFGYVQKLLWLTRIGSIRANNAIQLDKFPSSINHIIKAIASRCPNSPTFTVSSKCKWLTNEPKTSIVVNRHSSRFNGNVWKMGSH